MSFAAVRAVIESKVWDQFQAMNPAVPVVFDNVQETPPALPYVMCWSLTTPPQACDLPWWWRCRAFAGQFAAVLLFPRAKA